MKKIITIWILSLVSIAAQNKISFEFDYARFQYDSVSTYLEIYYSIGQGNLTPFNIEDQMLIGAYLDISITDTLINNILMNKRYISQNVIDTAHSELYINKNLIGNVGYVIPPGKYILTVTTTDIADTTNYFTYNEHIEIKYIDRKSYSISDLQFASKIITDSKNSKSIFFKNTMEVIPNPLLIYTEQMPILFFYSELYNLDLMENKGAKLNLFQQLNSSSGRVLESKRKVISQKNSSIVEAGAVNLKKYPTGSYSLQLSLFLDSMKVGISSAKRFYLINPSVLPVSDQVVLANIDMKSSEFGLYSEEECDEMMEVCRPIAREQDIDTYEKLTTLDSKRDFVFRFWKMRDMEPDTPQNEFKDEYMERVNFVEGRYKTFNRRGIKTDRGRVYLINGEPDEVDYHPNDYNTKPYELWTYHSIEGGVEFIFGDITGYNDYELLHSTKRGELRDDNWQRRISVD